jgi:hypothetical protein
MKIKGIDKVSLRFRDNIIMLIFDLNSKVELFEITNTIICKIRNYSESYFSYERGGYKLILYFHPISHV